VTAGLREATDDIRRSVAVLAARVRDVHAPLYKRAALSAAGGALALMAVVATAGSAHAASFYKWSATGTQADVVGAYAYGKYTYDPANNRVSAQMTIRGSVEDGASGRAYFRWRLSNGTTQQYAPIMASGFMAEKSATYTHNWVGLDTSNQFEVKECKVDNGLEVNCGGWDVVPLTPA
jgi:hypothetical protein